MFQPPSTLIKVSFKLYKSTSREGEFVNKLADRLAKLQISNGKAPQVNALEKEGPRRRFK